jgi:hypothetical protein
LHLLLSNFEDSPSLMGKGGNGGHAAGINVWSTDMGNYWSDWLSPDVQRDSIVDQPYRLDGNAMDSKPLAYLTAIPWLYYYGCTESSVSLYWDTNYTLIDSNGFEIFRNSTQGNEVFTTSGDGYDDGNVAPYGNYDYCVRVNDNGFVGMTSGTLNVQVPEYTPPELEIISPEGAITSDRPVSHGKALTENLGSTITRLP